MEKCEVIDIDDTLVVKVKCPYCNNIDDYIFNTDCYGTMQIEKCNHCQDKFKIIIEL